MKTLRVRVLALGLCLSPLAINAQTWVGGSGNNTFGTPGNWDPVGVPTTGANLIFNTPGNNFVGFNSLPFTVNSLTFGTDATNGFTINGNGGTLTLTGGITTSTPSSGNFPGITLNNGVVLNLSGPQTWTTATNANLIVNSTITAGSDVVTKAGSGSLILNGSNGSFSGGWDITAGAVYFSQNNPAPDSPTLASGTGTITVGATGTIGASFGDTWLSNNITLANGATLGGSPTNSGASLELTGGVSVAGTTASFKIGAKSDVYFGGAVTAASPGTALTVQSTGTGIAILGGTVSNITSITADNSAVAFGHTGALPTSIQAINGGYVSVAEVGAGANTPGDTAVLDRIIDRGSFNGTLGFDTAENMPTPRNYTAAIDLSALGMDDSAFVDGNIRIGSATSAILSGTITPVAQTFRFGGYAGQGGALVIQSDLEDNLSATGVSVVSPTASGGAAQDGLLLILQGNNSFTGNVSVSESSVILDSANALPGITTISLGDRAYAGYTENSALSFADFSERIASNNATSILGIDSADVIDGFLTNTSGSVRSIDGETIDLSGRGAIYLGTMTGATIDATSTIIAPTGGTLRLVNMADEGFTINTVLNHANGTVIGMTGSEGAVILAAQNTYSGGTSLLGGQLLVGQNTTTALGSGTLTVASSMGQNILTLGTASGNASLANDISVTGALKIGTGGTDEDTGHYIAGTTGLTLSGVIGSVTTGAQLHITGVTTLSGANTYNGGTFVRADTTVTSNSGLGTGMVALGYSHTGTQTRSVLTFDTANPNIGTLGNASNFMGQSAGTGNIHLTSNVVNLTINQTMPQAFSGDFTGTAANLIKNGGAQLTLLGNNAGQIASTTINAGSIGIGDSGFTTTASFGGNVTLNGVGTALFFRPGNAQDMTFGGNISGNGTVTVNGGPGSTVAFTGTNTYIGNTTVSFGALNVNGSLDSATVIVNANALFGSTGDLNNVTLNGVYRPGLSNNASLIGIDALTMSGTGLLHMELGGTTRGSGYDALNISGAFTVNGSLSVTFINSFMPTLGDTFNLFDWGSQTGTFNTLNLQSLGGGLFWDTSALYSTGVLSVTAVPEPSTYAALAGALALGVVMLRRRRFASVRTL